jgi:replication initiation and membrane attachment protein DnaB
MGSESNKGPQSLSESVNKRSNLSGMLNRRQNLNESKNSDDSFVKKMQKLAGIK